MKTKFHISAGGVVYRIHEGRPQFALTLAGGRLVWCLPKGLVEKDESPEAAGGPDDHDWEVDQVGWFFQEEALKIMSYPSERDILVRATGMIEP